jgi:phage gp29-like protein
MLDECITQSLVRLVIDMNAGVLAEMGLAGAKSPRFKSLHMDREDPEKFLRTVQIGQACGMRIGADDAHRRSGIPRPAEDEDVLETPKAESTGMFGDLQDAEDVVPGEDDKPGTQQPKLADGRFGSNLAALASRVAKILRIKTAA